MKQWKRLFYYLLINVLVSACTVLAVLTLWERTHPVTSNTSLLPFSLGNQAIPTAATATAQLTSTLPAAPTAAIIAYEVQAGDTLGDIAQRYGAELQAIMTLNGLTDPKSLSSEQTLYIPLPPGISPAQLTKTPEAATPASKTEVTASNPTDNPAEQQNNAQQNDAQVVIANIFGVGDLATERVRLERIGDGDLTLSNWTLQDQNNHTFTFPELTLYKGGAIDIYTGPGTNGVVALYWGLDQPVWQSGAIATLKDAQGKEQATFKIP